MIKASEGGGGKAGEDVDEESSDEEEEGCGNFQLEFVFDNFVFALQVRMILVLLLFELFLIMYQYE